MPLTQEKAKQNLSSLLAKFERELAAHKIREYNEEAAKTAFIQPFLKDVLGWDVNDRDEVSPEEKISRGRVDYGLKVEGKTKIFVEAKPPRAELSRHIDQAVRYGYNRKGVPFVLLTDFEGIKLFDVTVKPDVRNPLKGLKLDLERFQYLDNFDELWQLSKESVVSGKLDELQRVRPKERLPVDKAILEDLKRWREILAKDIFKNNPELFHSGEPDKDANYLKEITQKILDRTIFMRSCEDRALYHGRSLKEIFEERTDTVGTGTMVFLKKEFENYNIFFDSDLFSPKEWETKLAVDFKVMREIILDTYNPYQFDVIPLEVLGNIYEQYLGYTIRLTEHQVKYDLKPEVRKAGGIYYTPEYIVDYIVKNTIGKMLQALPEIKAKKLRILDPACGSGSFLIRAYEEMLKYYQEQKTKRIKPREGEKKLGLPEEKLRLSIDEKRNILIDHIFGVDIDEQAVEITKLSLMLKMLDGEHGIPAGRGILPMLDRNIKCGNSLISGNALELRKYFGEDWYMAKPFNWEDEFPQIMKGERGFGAVIGNPPYIRIQALKEWAPREVEAYKKSYKAAERGNYDIYVVFIERGLKLLKKTGKLGFILPHKFFTAEYGKPIRRIISGGRYLDQVVHFGDQQVFAGATTYTCLLFLNKGETDKLLFTRVKDLANFDRQLKTNVINLSSEEVNSNEWHFERSALSPIFKRLTEANKIMRDVAHVFVGTQTSADDIFVLERCKKIDGHIIGQSKRLGKEVKVESACLLPFLRGKEIRRYNILSSASYLICPYEISESESRLYSHLELAQKFPLTLSYLEENKVELGQREKGRMKGDKWYAFCYPKSMTLFKKEKIIVPDYNDKASFTYDESGHYFKTGYGIIPSSDAVSIFYLLGLLNSNLLFKYLVSVSTFLRGGYYRFWTKYIEQIPIHLIDPCNNAEKELHDGLDAYVKVMLDLNNKIKAARGAEKDQIQRQIEKTDREIDDIVYELYGITDEERRIIEG